MKRKKTVMAVALAIGLAQNSAHAAFEPVIQLGDLDGITGFRLDGDEASDQSGFSVSSAGDVNGDGISDLLIGAPFANSTGNSSGSSYVVFGKNIPFESILALNSLNGTNGFRLDGVAYDYSGRAVSTAGDINGDGFDDLIIGANGANPNGNDDAGSSYVVFGKNTPFEATLSLSSLNGTNGFRLDGVAQFDYSGRSVSVAGDINGDGFDDLLIGATLADPNGSFSGSTYLLFGKSTAFTATLNLSSLDGTTGFRMDGVGNGDQSGSAVSVAGDVNGDGFDDLLIGAPFADSNGYNSGSSYVVFGKNTAFNPTLNLSSLDGTNGFRLEGAAMNHRSGRAVSSAGDVNGDGIDDVFIGVYLTDPDDNSEAGSSYVVFGKTTPFASTLNLSTLDGTTGFRLDGVAPGNQSGRSVSSAGDVNADGIGDLLIGAPNATGANLSEPSAGSSYVVFGKTTPFTSTINLNSLDGTSGFRLDGVLTGDQSGRAVSKVGDVNGDGIDDVLIGAKEADPNGNNLSGSSYVMFGRVTGDPLLDFDQNLTDFGDIYIGAVSDTQTIILSNPGTGLVSIDTITLANPVFTISGGNCGAIPIRISVGLSCSLDFQFTPQATGVQVTEVLFEGSSLTGPDSIFFQGNGVMPPIVSLQPDPLVFADTALGNSTSQTLVVENIGASMLEPGTVSIQGTDMGDFSVTTNSCIGAQLEANESCDIEVSFTPTAAGSRQAVLQLESNAPSSPDFVELQGSNDVIFEDGFE